MKVNVRISSKSKKSHLRKNNPSRIEKRQDQYEITNNDSKYVRKRQYQVKVTISKRITKVWQSQQNYKQNAESKLLNRNEII